MVDSVSKLLGQILTNGTEEQKNQLLTLAGVMPSKIHGCTVAGKTLIVESGGDYAGGMIGQGDGVEGLLRKEGLWKCYRLTRGDSKEICRRCCRKCCDGRCDRCVNNTLGVGQFIPFD